MWPFDPPEGSGCPRRATVREEYEDACRAIYPQRIGTSGRRIARVAVSDGASESAFAREWANVLANAFVTRPPDVCGLSEDSLRGCFQRVFMKALIV